MMRTSLISFYLFSTKRFNTKKCGVRGGVQSTAGGISQIVGGEKAAPLEFPWQISLRIFNVTGNYERGHTCGGSIINKQHVMTAAHCVDGRTPAEFIVVVGDQNIQVQDPTEEKIGITMHPQYNSETITYDYAILKLNKTLDFNGQEKHLMPICLPTLYQNFDGQTCTASGWGLTKDRSQGGNTTNPDLLKVDLPIVPYDECSRDYKGINQIDRNTMICAGLKEGGKATCQGDSGGPLQCPRRDGRSVLAGLTSWGTTCAAPNQPTVFARVSTQLLWIYLNAGATP
ncbi:hypothetical protein HPB47_013128 [Ixodes persulcatus]|uniref:Uncharacterized protein n=1 Tax=Ixodes persulcatus TaxID=34615 RepID=A0AC60NRM9_IXOPE|nr:hypothetical protein HPB47_013128 [Ixodes persulcatus]